VAAVLSSGALSNSLPRRAGAGRKGGLKAHLTSAVLFTAATPYDLAFFRGGPKDIPA